MSGRIGLDSKPTPLFELLAQGIGLLSETFPTSAIGNNSQATDGTIFGTMIALRAGWTITNIHVRVATAGASTTLAKVGLYDTSGNRLAASADLSTAWESQGAKTHALSAAYVVPTTGVYYAVLVNKGTTAQFARGAGSQYHTSAIGSGPRAAVSMGSQTDLPASATWGNSSFGYWFGVS